jgi:hypothetical protein
MTRTMKVAIVLSLSASLAGCIVGDQGAGDSDQGAAVGDKEEFVKGCSKRSFPTYRTQETNPDGRTINYTFISECDTQEAIYDIKKKKINTDLCSAFAGGLSQVPALERIGGVTAYFCDLASVAGDLTILELERLSQKGGNCGIVRIDTFTPRVLFGVRWNYKHDVSWRPQVCPQGVSSLLGAPAPLVASPDGGGDPDDPSQLSYLGLPVAAPGEVDFTPVEVDGGGYLVASPIEAEAASCATITIPVRLDEGVATDVRLSSLTAGSIGGVSFGDANTIQYTPYSAGTDTFTYRLSDRWLGLDVSNVVNVTSRCDGTAPTYGGQPVDDGIGKLCADDTFVASGRELFVFSHTNNDSRYDHPVWMYRVYRWDGHIWRDTQRYYEACSTSRTPPAPGGSFPWPSTMAG